MIGVPSGCGAASYRTYPGGAMIPTVNSRPTGRFVLFVAHRDPLPQGFCFMLIDVLLIRLYVERSARRTQTRRRPGHTHPADQTQAGRRERVERWA